MLLDKVFQMYSNQPTVTFSDIMGICDFSDILGICDFSPDILGICELAGSECIIVSATCDKIASALYTNIAQGYKSKYIISQL